MRLLHDRNELIHTVERLEDKGGFAVSLGKAALLADDDNLEILVKAFPAIFSTSNSIRLIK
jgi:hypothetical protein